MLTMVLKMMLTLALTREQADEWEVKEKTCDKRRNAKLSTGQLDEL
jgi:hypothetical protein